MEGIITDIHRTSTVDGPGIRTAVFLKGCPLRCIWCHNPETQSAKIEKGYGRRIAAEAVVTECLKDRVYYETGGGGVTVTGGEPIFQFNFAREIMVSLQKEGIHTALDTCGYGKQEHFVKSLDFTDLYLFDYKASSPAAHTKLTNAQIGPVLDTLDMLYENGASIIIRCPLIPGVNDNDKHLRIIAALETKYPDIVAVDILPWHTMGSVKNSKLGIEVDPQLPKENTSSETIENYKNFFKKSGSTKTRIAE